MKSLKHISTYLLKPSKPMHVQHSAKARLSQINTTVLIQLAVLLSLPYHQIQAENLFIPDEYPSIEDAIAAAKDGDSLYIGPGVYHEFDIVIE